MVLVRFEVQIRCARVDRVDQHFLQEAHHRCVFDFGLSVGRFLWRGIVGDVELEVA